MTWRDNLLQGSLGGAEFEVVDHEYEIGRRVASFEFPLNDTPETEDLGRSQDKFSLDVFVIEPNYLVKRDALIDVVRAEGPHLLVHPYLGERTVRVTSARIRESTREGGIARITLTCVESGEEDAIQVVDVEHEEASELVFERAATTFAEEVSEPSTLLSDVLGFMETLRRVNARIGDALSVISEVDQAVELLTDEVQELLRTPYLLATRVFGLIASVMDLIRTFVPEEPAAGMYQETLDLGPFVLAVVEDLLPAPANPSTDQVAFRDEVSYGVLASAATTLAGLEYASATDATDTLARWSELLDAAIGDGHSATVPALENLRAAFAFHMTRVAQNLPLVVQWEQVHPIPAVVLAWRLYSDADRAEEILARNAVDDPLSIVGLLEVLSV